MQTLAVYLDELKKIKGIEKDSGLARFLKISSAHVSQIRSGSHMGEVKCFDLAESLGREPLELLSLNRAIRNNECRLREYWLGVHVAVKMGNKVGLGA